jgi:hypothetical protein
MNLSTSQASLFQPRHSIAAPITLEDIAVIDLTFKKKPHSNSRRCQAAWTNRLRRFALACGISDNDLVVFDFDWDLAGINQLWNLVRLTPATKPWKTESKLGWHFLIQYVYRPDIADNIVVRAQEDQATALSLTAKFDPITGYRVKAHNRQILDSNFGELLMATGRWFGHVAIVCDGCLFFKQLERTRVTLEDDLQAPPHKTEIRLEIKQIKRAIEEISSGLETSSISIYSYLPACNSTIDSSFVPFEESHHETRSGTILVAHRDTLGGSRLFLINTHTWTAEFKGRWEPSDFQNCAIAAHYRHLRAVNLLGCG